MSGDRKRSGFAAKRERDERRVKQRELKAKYGVTAEDENVIVVEKTNVYKFTVRLLIAALKTVASIAIGTLATIGLLTLIYPALRSDFVHLLSSLYGQAMALLGV